MFRSAPFPLVASRSSTLSRKCEETVAGRLGHWNPCSLPTSEQTRARDNRTSHRLGNQAILWSLHLFDDFVSVIVWSSVVRRDENMDSESLAAGMDSMDGHGHGGHNSMPTSASA